MKIIILFCIILITGCNYEKTYTFKESKVDSLDRNGVNFKISSNEIKYIKYEDFPLMRNASLYIGLPVVIACKNNGECEFH